MIRILYFASIREALDCDGEALDAGQEVKTVATLIDRLVTEHGEAWERALRDPVPMVAVNQEMGDLDSAVRDGDEVAFFPPVTGG